MAHHSDNKRKGPKIRDVGPRYKDDDPKTPADPDERRRGSNVNQPGSASTGEGIKLTPAIVKALENKVKEHNEKHGDDPAKRATLRALKAVYRRGAGAFSTSHRPSVTSRNQWAMARVNAFLFLLRNGKPSNAKYVTDNDLLPEDHPRSSKKKVKKTEATFDDVLNSFLDVMTQHEVPVIKEDTFKPPQAAANAARRGLELRDKFNRGGTAVGVARARDLMNRQNMPLSTIARMVSFFARHSVNREAAGSESRGFWADNSNPSAGWIAWLLWGGDPGRRWAEGIWRRNKKSISKAMQPDEVVVVSSAFDLI